MCGIWGFITTEKGRGTNGRMKFVHQAAMVGTLRGWDSTGAFLVPHVDKDTTPAAADWCKVVGTGQDFLLSEYAQEKLAYKNVEKMRAIVGHNRAATTGKVTLDNAHPFTEGSITLVHNGTLDVTADMPVPMWDAKGKGRKKIEVDSHLIAHNLASHDRVKVLESLSGAFTLVWHDATNDSIYMARNSQRPMFLMKPSCEDTVLFASEPDMLWWLAGRCSFARSTIHSLDTGVLLEFKAGELKPSASRFTLGKGRKYTSYYSGNTSTTTSRPAATPGKELAPAQGTQVSGAGTTKKAKQALALGGFAPSDKLEFSVDQIVPVPGTDRCVVNGWAYFDHPVTGKVDTIQAILYGVSAPFARFHEKADWNVRPVALTMVGEKGKEQEALVCRLVSVCPTSSPSGTTYPTSTEPLTTTLYPGPGGKKLTATHWIVATTGGCVECGRQLNLREADEIMWVSEQTRPLCPDCTRKWADDIRTTSAM